MKRKEKERAPQGGIFEEVIRQGGRAVRAVDGARLRVAAKNGAYFMLSLLLSSVGGPCSTYPYGYGVVMAATGGFPAAFAFCGAVLGTVTMESGGAVRALILCAMFISRIGVCIVTDGAGDRQRFFRSVFCERGSSRVLTAVFGAAVYGAYSLIAGESLYYGVFSSLLGIGEAFVVTLGLVLFEDVNARRSCRIAGLGILTVGFVASLELFSLPFSLGAVVAFLLSVYFSSAAGAAVGCIVGFSGGMALGGDYGAVFGAVGIVCALLWEYSPVGAVVASSLTASVTALFCSGLTALSQVIPEVAFGAALASVAASAFKDKWRLLPFLDFDRVYDDLPAPDICMGARYAKVGDALKELSRMLCSVGDRLRLPTKAQAGDICERTRAKHCTGCVHHSRCAGSESMTVDSMFSNMAYRLTTNGSVSARIVPESIASRCFNMDGMIEDINRETRKATGLSEGARRAEMFASDYSAVADLLQTLSGEDESACDTAGQKSLERELATIGFRFLSSSVYGKRKRRIYMRGVDLAGLQAGEKDIRECAEHVLGGRFSSPEFSVDGKYVSAAMRSLPAFSVESGRFAAVSRRDETGGDSTCFFKNPDGYFYSLVSDGMGSGMEAALTSGITAEFLKKLLSAGCPMRSALELLNCFVCGSSGECFTTVDVMEADLYTGRARFIKSGAAPSFIIRNGQLYRIHSKTIPVGIMQALDAEAVAFDLCPGDTVIMVSDGVTGSYEDCPWLYELLTTEIGEMPPRAAARYIGEAAVKNTGKEDDITVCVMRVESA